jgi:hypothetical protein
MATSSLMIINIDTPPTQLGRSARVAYAQRAVQLALQELAHSGGNLSNGSVIGVDSAGTPNQSLRSWAFDSHDP